MDQLLPSGVVYGCLAWLRLVNQRELTNWRELHLQCLLDRLLFCFTTMDAVQKMVLECDITNTQYTRPCLAQRYHGTPIHCEPFSQFLVLTELSIFATALCHNVSYLYSQDAVFSWLAPLSSLSCCARVCTCTSMVMSKNPPNSGEMLRQEKVISEVGTLVVVIWSIHYKSGVLILPIMPSLSSTMKLIQHASRDLTE